MATITVELSAKSRRESEAKNAAVERQIKIRVNFCRQNRPTYKTGIWINEKYFSGGEIVLPHKGKLNFAEVDRVKSIKEEYDSLRKRIMKIIDAMGDTIDAPTVSLDDILHLNEITRNVPLGKLTYDSITEAVANEKETKRVALLNEVSFFDYMAQFRDTSRKKVNGKRNGDKSDVWKKNFDVLIRALQRYEMFVPLYDKKRKEFRLTIDSFNKELLEDFADYLRNEHTLLDKFPQVYMKIPYTTDTKRRSPKPRQRGANTICALYNKLHAFFNWLIDEGLIRHDPFSGFDGVENEKYGTPYYLTLEERNIIADFDLSSNKSLETQRDIFIFQCVIGCRVADLLRMTTESVVSEAVEYIPNKTKGEKPKVIRVPLNDRAKAILNKYKDFDMGGKLLPFISAQKYNNSIKKVFKICGICRLVTIINPTTGEEEKRPLNEVASSHIARRTFVGNLYKQVKDPNLIGKLSGHSEGSKAFARYRDIDEDLKKELVDLIG